VGEQQQSINVKTPPDGKRIAIVTVHGVSEHYRYKQLATFALTMADAMRSNNWHVPDPTLVETLVDKSSGTSVVQNVPAVLRLTPIEKNPQVPQSISEIEIRESYWSPLGKNHAQPWRFVRWVYDYPRILIRSRPYRDVKGWDDFWSALRAMGIILLMVILPIGTTIAAFALAQAPLAGTLLAICYTVATAVVLSDLVFAGLAMKRRRSDTQRAEALQKVLEANAGGIGPETPIADTNGQIFAEKRDGFSSDHRLAGLLWLFSMLPKLSIAAGLVLIAAIINPFRDHAALEWPRFVALLVDTAIVYALYGPLAKARGIVSDIVAYSAINENADLAVVHDAIVQKVADDIMTALTLKIDNEAYEWEKRYDEVWVFGHSLGASVAYEALLLLYRRARQGGLEMAMYQKICGFVTYGSAIEKIENYVVDRHARDGYVNTGIRAYPRKMFRGESVPEDKRALWLNFWFRNDFIASSMSHEQFLEVCSSYELLNGGLFTSHVEYDKNPDFWKRVIHTICH
jgi:hypothetical protein